ncbi:unnamed protein product [Pleuronectes platessa]|uniref:Uncharacterized protein n=1 Tax=Pleuronectes platessa TaxID=8262 RepID=A0A9N7YIZ4_PLEPL|nr:unnamed protein product [Pleuronectes platessa]
MPGSSQQEVLGPAQRRLTLIGRTGSVASRVELVPGGQQSSHEEEEEEEGGDTRLDNLSWRSQVDQLNGHSLTRWPLLPESHRVLQRGRDQSGFHCKDKVPPKRIETLRLSQRRALTHRRRAAQSTSCRLEERAQLTDEVSMWSPSTSDVVLAAALSEQLLRAAPRCVLMDAPYAARLCRKIAGKAVGESGGGGMTGRMGGRAQDVCIISSDLWVVVVVVVVGGEWEQY